MEHNQDGTDTNIRLKAEMDFISELLQIIKSRVRDLGVKSLVTQVEQLNHQLDSFNATLEIGDAKAEESDSDESVSLKEEIYLNNLTDETIDYIAEALGVDRDEIIDQYSDSPIGTIHFN